MLKEQLLNLASHFEAFILLETGGATTANYIAGIGCTANLPIKSDSKQIDDFIAKHKGSYIFSHLSYDFKNQLEDLNSENEAVNFFSETAFWIAECVVVVNGDSVNYYFSEEASAQTKAIIANLEAVNSLHKTVNAVSLHALTTKEQYLKTCGKIQQHLQAGDIYELNYCIAFIANAAINPVETYANLLQLTEAPMSCFYRSKTNYLLCGSPERFIKKEGQRLISQPIKGTIKRASASNPTNVFDDEALKAALQNSEKERSENVMIVDLVRNDLSRIAMKGSVKVDELCGVYSFKTVHHLISTVSCNLKADTTFMEIIRATFPMGSMTGAPKVRAMQLIEKYENTKRGLFAGTVGYIAPNGDFDFNVVIRSIFYNAAMQKINVWAGSAITINSIPESEYEECMLKMEAMIKVLNAN